MVTKIRARLAQLIWLLAALILFVLGWSTLGVVATPGVTFGAAGSVHVRLAAVQPDDRIELVRSRAGLA